MEQGGFGVLETVGLLGNGGFLLIAAQSLKGQGKQKILNFLSKLNISPKYHSKFTLMIVAVILLGSFCINKQLPQIGQWQYRRAEKLYNKGKLSKAQKIYQQAKVLDPGNSNINIGIGETYESLGELDKASNEYKVALEKVQNEKDSAQAFNNLGRVNIRKDDFMMAEALLRMGLQRVKEDDIDDDIELKYQLNRNLGWALLEQKKYEAAEKQLKKAIEFDQQNQKKTLGRGMAYCLLGKVLDSVGKTEQAQQQWQSCRDNANPETINEYRWFIEANQADLADKINTSSIIE